MPPFVVLVTFHVLLLRGGRTREYPCSLRPADGVDLVTHRVPHLRHALPFVEDTRALALQDDVGICQRKLPRVLLVEIGNRGPVLPCGPRLAAPLGSGDFHCTEDLQVPFDLGVDDSGHVAIGSNFFRHGGILASIPVYAGTIPHNMENPNI